MPRLAICTSFGEEYGLIKSRLRRGQDLSPRVKRTHRGEFHQVPVDLVLTGVGRRSIEEWFATDLDEYLGVLLLGYCGAVAPALQVGDLVMPQQVMNEFRDEVEIDPVAVPVKASVGSMLTVDRLVREQKEKAQLARAFGAETIDMETFHAARRAREKGVALVVLKAVADGLTDDLPDFGAQPTAESIKEGVRREPQRAASWRQNMRVAGSHLERACEVLIPALHQLWSF
jgi:nucleoside phosphorylase